MPQMLSTRVLAATASVAVALTLAGCSESGVDDDVDTGGGSSSPTSQPAGDDGEVAGELEGRAFVGDDVTVGGEPRPLAADTVVRLSFADGELGAEAGCNSMGGPYRLDGDTLVVEGLSSTEMACVPEARMEQDSWLAEILTDTPSVTVVDDTLVVEWNDTVLRLTDEETASPDHALVGTAWVLDTVMAGSSADADGVASSVDQDVVVRFSPDGVWEIDGSLCAPTTGTWELDDEGAVLELSTDAVVSCDAVETDLDLAVTAVFREEFTVGIELDGGRLSLVGESVGLSFRAQD